MVDRRQFGFRPAGVAGGCAGDAVCAGPLLHPIVGVAAEPAGRRAMVQCARRVRGRKAILLRTQAAGGNVAAALAVAKTFCEAVSDAWGQDNRAGRVGQWALVECNTDGLDMLLVATDDGVLSHQPLGENVFVVPLHRLLHRWPDAQAIHLARPGGSWRRQTPSLAPFRTWLWAERHGRAEGSEFGY